ncbi:MAG: hypothetical protein WBO54_05590 [Thermoanaerobaculia bacterium]
MLSSVFMRNSTVILLLLLAFLCRPAAALAYLDPAAGSLILQVILGGVAGLIVLLKLYWRRLRGFFGFSDEGGDQDDQA